MIFLSLCNLCCFCVQFLFLNNLRIHSGWILTNLSGNATTQWFRIRLQSVPQLQYWLVVSIAMPFWQFSDSKPSMVSCDFERGIWAAIETVITHAKVCWWFYPFQLPYKPLIFRIFSFKKRSEDKWQKTVVFFSGLWIWIRMDPHSFSLLDPDPEG